MEAIRMTVSDLVKRFGKSMLLSMAEELEIADISNSTHSFVLVQEIQKDLSNEGIPEDDEMSDDLYDFCIAAGLLDEDGNVIEEDTEDEEEEGGDIGELPDKLPACWGLADKTDTACSRCPIVDQCGEQRIKSRPRCFGVMYDAGAEKCAGSEEREGCVEFADCKRAYVANKKSGKVK
jgi:hypothetical protein